MDLDKSKVQKMFDDVVARRDAWLECKISNGATLFIDIDHDADAWQSHAVNHHGDEIGYEWNGRANVDDIYDEMIAGAEHVAGDDARITDVHVYKNGDDGGDSVADYQF